MYGSKKGQPLPPFEYQGWKLVDQMCKYKDLFTDKYTKGDYEVHCVNEHEDAAGGAEDTCFFSDKKGDLEKLCEDWGFDKSKIKAGKAVKQTL